MEWLICLFQETKETETHSVYCHVREIICRCNTNGVLVKPKSKRQSEVNATDSGRPTDNSVPFHNFSQPHLLDLEPENAFLNIDD